MYRLITVLPKGFLNIVVPCAANQNILRDASDELTKEKLSPGAAHAKLPPKCPHFLDLTSPLKVSNVEKKLHITFSAVFVFVLLYF